MAHIVSISYKPMQVVGRTQDFIRRAVSFATLIAGYGIEGDRKGGHPKRQLNIVSTHTLATLRSHGYDIAVGAIGEQMVIDGIDIDRLPIGTRLQLGESACVEITMHRTGCPKLARLRGDSVVRDDTPLGVMVKVVQGGRVHVGDVFRVNPVESGVCLNT